MPKGLNYVLEPEKLREYRRMTDEQKFRWLEEALVFSEMALTPRAKKIREYFRSGRRSF